MARSIDETIDTLFSSHERLCMLKLISASNNPDTNAERLRKMLFGIRLRLERDGCDYYQLSIRIAYHFHKDRAGMVARLTM